MHRGRSVWPIAVCSALILALAIGVWFLPATWQLKIALTIALYGLFGLAAFLDAHGLQRGRLKILLFILMNSHWVIVGPVVLLGMIVVFWACAWGIASIFGLGTYLYPDRLLISAGAFVACLLLLNPLATLLEPIIKRIEHLTEHTEAALQANLVHPLNATDEANKFSSGRFAVYLRPFDADGSFSLDTWQRTSRSERLRNLGDYKIKAHRTALEDAIFRACNNLRIDVRQVGVPSGLTSGLEIRSALVEDSVWREIAEDLIIRARVIFLIPSTNPGTLWEMSKIQEHQAWRKTIVMVPNGIKDDTEDSFQDHAPEHVSYVRRRAVAALGQFGFECDKTRSMFYRLSGNPMRLHSEELSMVRVQDFAEDFVYFPIDAVRDCMRQ